MFVLTERDITHLKFDRFLFDAQAHQVASAQLAIDGEIEQSQIPLCAVVHGCLLK